MQSRAANRVGLLNDIYKNSMDNSKIRQQVLFALNQTREPQAVTIIGNIAGKDLASVSKEVDAAIKRAGEVPRGVTVSVRGQVPPMQQTLSGLQTGLLLAIATIFLLLVANFRARARQAGIGEVTIAGKHVRFAPVELPDSRVVRLNRIYPGKGCGLVVDYCGVAKHLTEALAMYSRTDFSISAQIPAARPSHCLAAWTSPAWRASTAEARALAWAREMVLSTLKVVSKYCTPTGPSYSARASASSRIRSSAVAPGCAASLAW